MRSLRVKILFWNAFGLLATAAVVSWLLVIQTNRMVHETIDQSLSRRMDQFLRRPRNQPFGEMRPQPGPPPGPMGEVRIIGPNTNQLPYDPKSVEAARKGSKVFSSVLFNDRPHRIISFPIEGPNGEREVAQIMQDSSLLVVLGVAQRQALASVIAVASLATLVAAGLLTRLVLSPVKRLSDASTEIAQHPESTARVSVVGDDEIANLSARFNEMADSLQESRSEALQALERQRRFSSDAAHELRTPLTGISLAVENALNEQATETDRVGALEKVGRLTSNMTKLTEMLLALSRIDSRKEQMPLTQLELVPILEDAIRISDLDSDPRLKLNLTPVSVTANVDAITQIARNLLDNAKSYTEAGKSITVTTSESGFSVANEGPGIAAEHQAHVFDRFYRVDSSRARNSGGYGLGLSIAQSLAHSINAELKVVSDGETFAEFFVTFSKNVPSS